MGEDAKNPQAPVLGRCIYCDERCSADTWFHQYCKDSEDPGPEPETARQSENALTPT